MAWWADIIKVVAEGYKLLFLRRFLPGKFVLSLGQLTVLLALVILTNIAIDYVSVTQLYAVNPAGFSANVAGWAAFAIFLNALKTKGRFVSVQEVLAASAVLNLWIVVPFGLILVFFNPDPSSQELSWLPNAAMYLFVLWVIAFVWQFVSLFWAGYMLGQFGVRSFGLRTLLASILVFVLVPQDRVLTSLDPDPLRSANIWPYVQNWSYRAFAKAREDGESDSVATRKRVDFEALLDAQPERVANALESVQSSTPGKPHIYFIGMASDASQDVFMREVTATRDIFNERFATQGRSLVLNNNSDTADTLPIASLTNLRRTLMGVASKMDVEKDILVLFLTSHGSQGYLSVNFSRAPLNNLKAEDLTAILEASGIKNRVIIISACHSGSFIPALSNENTAIITAASTESVSFGCSNEREWTYFGDALINRALRETHSFADAFGSAKALISEWEQKDKLTPSNPQLSMGAAIAAKLDKLARDLETSVQKAHLE